MNAKRSETKSLKKKKTFYNSGGCPWRQVRKVATGPSVLPHAVPLRAAVIGISRNVYHDVVQSSYLIGQQY